MDGDGGSIDGGGGECLDLTEGCFRRDCFEAGCGLMTGFPPARE